MEIIELELQNGRLFSPTNGELLFDEKKGVNTQAATLAGWCDNDIHQPYYEPFIMHDGMLDKWQKYINSIEVSDKELELEPDPEEFLLKYDKDPTLLGFRLNWPDRKRPADWIVVKMPGTFEIL